MYHKGEVGGRGKDLTNSSALAELKGLILFTYMSRQIILNLSCAGTVLWSIVI